MIWAWIAAAVIISWLFCKKGISWHKMDWLLRRKMQEETLLFVEDYSDRKFHVFDIIGNLICS